MMRVIAALVFMFASTVVAASQYTKKGEVVDILLRTGSSHFAILYIGGFDEAGDCRTFRDHVVISVPDDEKANARYSMLLAIHMAGKDAHVMLDSSKKSADGSCILQDLRLNKDF